MKVQTMLKDYIKSRIPPMVYDFLLMLRNTIKFFGFRGIYREIMFRLKKSPDGYPVPPSSLIFLVVGHGMQHDYYCAGRTVAADLVEKAGKHLDFSTIENILDFGCGCGRIIRHIRKSTKANLYGTDLNSRLIQWDIENLPFAQFNTNGLLPGLPYKDKMFDFVYMISIFTHLSEKAQKQWMTEFSRIIRSGGVLLFTSHGVQYTKNIPEASLNDYEQGKYIEISKRSTEGSNYFGSYFNDEYVKNNLPADFELVSYVPGRSQTDLEQDIFILKKR